LLKLLLLTVIALLETTAADKCECWELGMDFSFTSVTVIPDPRFERDLMEEFK
jgi:hypothetical protein